MGRKQGRGKGGRRGKRRGGRRGKGRIPGARMPGKTMPSYIKVKLRWPLIAPGVGSGAAVAAKRYTPNNAYDVDPSLGSTSTPGFSEWAAFYTYYRVMSYRVDVTAENLDTIAANWYIYHTNTDPGTTGTSSPSYAQTFLGATRALGFSTGEGKARYTKSVSVSKILGMPIGTADSFRSLVSAGPADLVYFGFGVYSDSGANFTSGITITGWIEMDVRFYGSKDLLTTFKADPAVQEAERLFYKMNRAKEMEQKFQLREETYVERKAQFEDDVAEELKRLTDRKSVV